MQVAAISKIILCRYVLKSEIICNTYERKMQHSSFRSLYLCTFASDKSCLTEIHRISQNLRPLPSHYLTLWEILISRLFLIYSCSFIGFSGRILPAGVEIVLQTAKPPDLFRPWKARKYLCSTTTKHWSARRNKWRRNTREAEREIQSNIGNMPWNEKYIKAYLIAVKRSVPRFGETGNFS